MCYLCLRKEAFNRSVISLEEGSLFTQGNNPWIDGITYNAKWGESSLVPTKVDVKILQPQDQKIHDLESLSWYQVGLSDGGWIKDGNPIARIGKGYRKAIKDGYKAWSDVADLDFNFVEDPTRSGVLVTFAKYENQGVKEGLGVLLGSHRGLLVDRNIVQADSQFGSQLGAESLLGSAPAPSPTPLILDLNYDYFTKMSPLDSGFMETIIHEVGHGIGMSHPHDSGLGSVPSGVFPGIQSGDLFASNGTGLYGLNQNVYTIMSYNRSSKSNGTLDEVHAITPMALELLAAQIKYGPNLSTRRGDNIYSLLDRTRPDRKAWVSIWDAGGADTISARGLRFGVEISLRAAEMNAQRPETGMPQEQYEWTSPWSDYQIALDFLVSAKASQPGALLGSGIRKSFIYSVILDEISGLGTYFQSGYSDVIHENLSSLSGALEILYEAYGFIGTFSLGSGKEEVPSDAPMDVQKALAQVDKAYRELTNILDPLESEGLVEFIADSGLASLKIDDYFQKLSEVEAVQSDVQVRSAKGVAGYISEIRRSEVSSLPAASRPGGGFTIAAGVTIENAIGGAGDDVITGNVADNSIRGLGGDDLIRPYLGSNKIRGGGGVDIVNFDSELGAWPLSELSFEEGDRWVKVTMGNSGDVNRLRGVEFLIFGGEQYAVDSLIYKQTV